MAKATKESDKKNKLIQEKCSTILGQLLRDEDNKYCCDCDSKGPRWASWNLGIFLCIRCAGIHRNLGVHISRVKSVNLDSWQPEQVVSLQQMGNSRARAVYEALLSDNFRRPQTDSGLETFIRAKYEQKKYIAREWIPPPPITKVDWDKEIEEEIENQKRKKKTASAASSLPEPIQKPVLDVPVPAPLPKPHSPKNSRSDAKKSSTVISSADLLGINLDSSSSEANVVQKAATPSNFDFFANIPSSSISPPSSQLNTNGSSEQKNSLKQEEDDFFNQKITADNGSSEKGKLTKDSILALYGNAPTFSTPPSQPAFNAGFQSYSRAPQDSFYAFGQPAPQQQIPANPGSWNFGNFNANFGTVQSQQINKLNEENIKKIESLNFNNFK